jgi:glycosyltransferase involved in cell wall biosynthesis
MLLPKVLRACRLWSGRGRRALGGSRPHLAVLSPYSPDSCAAACRTARLLAETCRHADVDLYTDAPKPQTPAGVRLAGRISSRPYFGLHYDKVVSVVANSRFHTRIVDVVRNFGGACIQYDNRLCDLYYEKLGPQEFARVVGGFLHRRISREEAEVGLQYPQTLKTPFLDEIVHAAEPLIVHSRGIQTSIKRQYDVAAEYLPFCPCHEFDDVELSDGSRGAARACLRLPPDRIMIAAFGALGPSKANVDCIWALEQLRAWHLDAELHFVGMPDRSIDGLSLLAREIGVSSFVHLASSHFPDATYRAYLIAADVGILLRTGGPGDLSDGLMDAISAGLPSVANLDLANAVDAPSYVRRIPDNISPILAAEQIAELLEGRGHATRANAERTQYVATRSFRSYTDQLMTVLGFDHVTRREQS